MKKLILALMIVSGSCQAEDDAMTHYLAMANVSGSCSVYFGVHTFQEAANMPGGDAFVVRFLTTEAARLGYTMEEFMAACVEVSNEYMAVTEVVEAMQ